MSDLVKSTRAFVEYHLGATAFAPLTGRDLSAWGAFVHLVDCYAHGGDTIAAMASTLKLAHPKVWNVFVQAIPAVTGWATVADLWPQIVQRTDLAPAIRPRYEELAATERIVRTSETTIRSHGLAKHGFPQGSSKTS